HGDARATRGAVTVTADRLIAHYRPRAVAAGAAPAPPVEAASDTEGVDTGGQQIYRLNAEGHVHIFTATDQAFGEHAVYDLDESVLVLTGGNLKLTTPEDVLTARRDLEYWPDKHMAVARGDAVVTTNTGRRLSADTLVAYTTPGTEPASSARSGEGSQSPPAAAATTDPLATSGSASGRIKRVEAFGHVVVRTATETISGDRGVYIPATGIALLIGDVRITRGENQLNGERAVVDMKTGVADLLSTPGLKVQGLVVPNSANEAPAAPPGAAGAAPTGQAPGRP
ncbi:MAG: LptA/OstA family protein, partial [Acetobacteraceae bacterium]